MGELLASSQTQRSHQDLGSFGVRGSNPHRHRPWTSSRTRIWCAFSPSQRNALVKQYQKLFELDKVGLRSHERTLLKPSPIKAIARKTGARGLRNVH